MSILNIKNKSTNEIKAFEKPVPLRIWAVNFIDKNNFTRDNFTTHKRFKELTRRQKDAIRYQLKKSYNSSFTQDRNLTKQSKQNQSRWIYFAKLSLSIWIAVFLMVDIVDVYLLKGASKIMAWQATVLVEICIIVSASNKNFSIRRLAKLLFAYNLIIFGVMDLDSLQSMKLKIDQDKIVTVLKKRELENLRRELMNVSEELKSNTNRMKDMYSRGYITSSTKSFEKIEEVLTDRGANISDRIVKLQESLATNHLKKNIHWMAITAFLYFILRAILQFFSIHLLRRD